MFYRRGEKKLEACVVTRCADDLRKGSRAGGCNSRAMCSSTDLPRAVPAYATTAAPKPHAGVFLRPRTLCKHYTLKVLDTRRTLTDNGTLVQCCQCVARLSCYPWQARQSVAAAAEFSPYTCSVRNPVSQGHMHCGLAHTRTLYSSDRQC